MVDTLGFILSVHVTGANLQDRDMIEVLGEKMRHRFPRIHAIFADCGYEGRQNKTFLKFGWLLNVVRRPQKALQIEKGFRVLPKRWIVERTFGWLGIFRRLAVDVEVLTTMAEAFIQIAAIALILKKIL